jgi:predicted enzyme related to lactoylglutathione lyase
MTDKIDPGLPRRLAHVAIRVRDMDRAVDFYSEVVGLDVRRRGIETASSAAARTPRTSWRSSRWT